MAETRKPVDGQYLTYQGKPLVREDDTIIYGDLNYDPFVLILEILSYKEAGGEKVPDVVQVQIVDAKDPNKCIQSTQKNGLHDAFALGCTWLDLKLKKNAMEDQ